MKNDMHKLHLKKLKRKKKLAGRAKFRKDLDRFAAKHGGREGAMRFILSKKKEGKKEKKEKPPLKPYRAVKLTAQLDKILLAIKNADPKDPTLEKLKIRRDQLKAKLK